MTVINLLAHDTPGAVDGDTGAEVPNVPSGVRDEATYFQTSQLVDSLRDTAIRFLEHPPATGSTVLAEMSGKYNSLRRRTMDLVGDEYAAATESATSDLPGDADVHSVVFAATQLAQWIDSIHVLPAYLLGQELQAASANEARTKLTSMSDVTDESDIKGSGTGNYL
jgi:hypothetical protein